MQAILTTVDRQHSQLVAGGGYQNYITGMYRKRDTFLRVFLPQDEKPCRSISVHSGILAISGWKVLTEKRWAALISAMPEKFTLHGERRDDGAVWYRLDDTELKAWVDAAVTLCAEGSKEYAVIMLQPLDQARRESVRD